MILRPIADFVSQDNPEAARLLERRIRTAVSRLSEQPAIGRRGRVDGTRELVVPGTPYIVAYKALPAEVVILAVMHGARQWPKDL